MAPERTRGGELAELMANHIFRHIYRNVLAAVVNRHGMADEIRENRAGSRPGLQNLFITGLIHLLHALEKSGLNERALFN